MIAHYDEIVEHVRDTQWMFRSRLKKGLNVSTITAGLAGRYATALYQLAIESKQVDSILQDLNSFKGLRLPLLKWQLIRNKFLIF